MTHSVIPGATEFAASSVRVRRRLRTSVVVRGLRGNDLQDVPVLDHLAVLVEPEDVDARVVCRSSNRERH
jgi:hypothetical protein